MNNVPKNLNNVDYKKQLRRLSMYEKYAQYKGMYASAQKVARESITKTIEPEVRESKDFTNAQVWDYYAKQIELVEVNEKIFEDTLSQFIDNLESKAISSIPNAVAKSIKKKEYTLFDTSAEVQAGIDLFTPLQESIATQAAAEAFVLLGTNRGYLPSENLAKIVARNTKLFTESFINTDREKLNALLTQGIEAGDSVANISTSMQEQFATFKKNQINRIVRTEVLRASNAGAVDAYEASGVVIGKQWLTSMDSRTCAYCAPLNGKVIGLRKVFFKKGATYMGDSDTPMVLDYSSIAEPPLHTSCRCTTIPVLKDIREASAGEITESTIEVMKKELEEERQYAKELEERLGL